ncbi:MAG: hypothetical protein ACQEQA_05565 [Bacillota bacterium]
MIEIKKLKASGKLYELTMENEDGTKETLKVHQDILVRHHLFGKKTLTENTVKTLKKENASALLGEKALNHIAKKDFSKEGLRKKLAPHGEKETVEDTLSFLEDVGYLDEDKALKRLVDDMWEFSLKGPGAIKDKALREHFEESDVDMHLSVYKDSDIEARLKRFVDKTFDRYSRYPKRKIMEKLLRQCINNGYDLDMARPIIERFLSSVQSEETEEALLDKRIDTIKDKYDLNDFKSKGKLIQKLMREGFDYETIKARLK